MTRHPGRITAEARLTEGRGPTRAGRRPAVVVLSMLLLLPALATELHAQDGSDSGTIAVTYPTTIGPAAAQVGAIFDVDVTTTASGAVGGAIRPAGTSGSWEPIEVVTLQETVEPGTVAATATVPAGTAVGTYDLVVRLLDAQGEVIGQAEAAASLIVEDYGRPTGFETRNGASLTTHTEELAFLADVVGSSDRGDISVIGESVQGRPLHLVRLGYPVAPTVEQAAQGRAVMFACTQHGNEPAPRESLPEGGATPRIHAGHADHRPSGIDTSVLHPLGQPRREGGEHTGEC